MIGKVLLTVLGAFGVSKLLSAGKTAKAADNLQFNPTAVKWSGFQNGAFNIKLTFSIINPTNTNVNISFLFCDVLFKTGTKITSINKENWNFVIKKESESEVDIPVKIYLSDLLFLGIGLIRQLRNGRYPKELNLKGYVKANDFTVPFDEIIEVI